MKLLKTASLICILLLITNVTTKAQWTQLGEDIDGEAIGDESGFVSLSSDGSRVAIGAPNNDDNGNNAGHVRVYDWQDSAWTQMGEDIDGDTEEDEFGLPVSLSSDGNRLAIGSKFNGANGIDAGQVKVYEWNGSAWIQLGEDILGEAAGDRAGSSISLSSNGSRLAIGAPRNDGNGTDDGQVRIFDWNGSAWIQIGEDIESEATFDYFGSSVSLSSDGSRLAIGAILNGGNGDNAGHVRVYDWDGMTWMQIGEDIDGEAALDRSGYSISLSSDGIRLAIGAQRNDGNGTDAGHVRIYEWDGMDWTQLGEDIDGESGVDRSGGSVSLSSDGSRLIIGALLNDGGANNSGHARIYEWDGMAWTQLGEDINGESLSSHLGSSVSLSSDGSRFAVGAPTNNGSSAGLVKIFGGFISSSDASLTDTEQAFTLFPNPATSSVQLIINGLPETSNAVIELLDVTGKIIYFKLAKSNNILSLSNYAVGVYFVLLRDLSTGQIIFSKKLIIK